MSILACQSLSCIKPAATGSLQYLMILACQTWLSRIEPVDRRVLRYRSEKRTAAAYLESMNSATPISASRWVGPRWVRLVLGVLLVLLGVVLVFRPFASLAVLIVVLVASLIVAGVGELLRRDQDARPWGRIVGVAYLVAAVVILMWPGATIRVVVVAAAVALLVGGVADLVLARRVRGTARFNAVIGGVVSIALGVLALAWPDITVLVIAVVFGARVLIAGVRQIVAFVKGDDVPLLHRPSLADTPKGGWLRLTGTVLGAGLAVLLVAVSLVLHSGSPRPDAFYDAPEDVPTQPGQLLRSEPYTHPEIPAGAKAWRILYTTTRDEGEPAIASGLVIAPVAATESNSTPSKVIAWAHGTTGFATGCAPSILPAGLSAGAMMIQDKVIAEGWTMVATDYVGLGTEGPHPYLIGQGEGRSVLDAIRAAHQLEGIDLDEETVIWGHSQGGHAALWAGMLAAEYAPELTIGGVAALAPASNLSGLIENLGTVIGGDLFAAFVVAAYTATYPDVSAGDYVRPGARILTEEMGNRCLAEKSVLVSVLTTLALDKPIWSGDPDSGAFGQRLRENVPSGPINAPLLIGQGGADSLVVTAAQNEYVKARCDAGQSVDYRTYEGLDHLPLIEPDSPAISELIAWTTDRFNDKPARNTC